MGSLKPWGCNDITSYRTNFWTCWIWCPRSVDNFPRDLQLAFFGGSESGSHKCCGAVHRLWEVCLALGVESQYSLLLNLLYNLILRQQRLPLIRLQPNNSNNWLLGWSEKHKSWKMQKYRADSEPRHSTDFRTIFGIMIGWFVSCEIGQT